MTDPVRFVTLAVTASPPAIDNLPMAAAPMEPTGIAVLVAERDTEDTWTFDLRARALTPRDPSAELLTWAATALPDSGILIGWQVAQAVTRPLLDAAGLAPPEVRDLFLHRFFALGSSGLVVDVSDQHGSGSTPLKLVAARHGIAFDHSMPNVGEDRRERYRSAIQVSVEQRAIATWRLWLMHHGAAAAQARAAVERWLARRRSADRRG